MRRFAHATLDPARRYFVEAAADRFGGPVAPPGFAAHAFRREADAPDPLDILASHPDYDGVGMHLREDLPPMNVALPRLLNGGYHYEFFGYFRVGESIWRRSRYGDVTQKQSKSGPMVFVIIEDEYSREDGVVYVKSSQTIILR